MARKEVNLLEGDDEEREDDSEEGSGDDGGSYERRRGGFVDVLMVILFVCVMLGGVAWAGYQFWWLPKVKKEAQLKRARMKQEQQRRMLLANRQGAQRTPGRLPQNAGAATPQRAKSATAQNIQPKRPTPSLPAEKKAMPQKSTPRSPAEKAPPATSAVMKKPAAPPKMEGKPRRAEAAMVSQAPGKKAPVPKAGPARSILRKKKVVEKKLEAPKAKTPSATGARKPTRGFYYSVQVASCRTERCADSFSKRLKSKGFSAFRVAGTSRATTTSRATGTSRARRRSGQQITEVRLGSFSSLAKARALANRVKKSMIEARVYRSDNQWRVAAGRFRNLEDAALLLDRAEDAGFRGELASRLQNGRSSRLQSGRSSRLQSGSTRKLYRIRTGKFGSLREALAFRKQIRLAGFSDAIVVRRRSRK